jgi:hypothetical protein
MLAEEEEANLYDPHRILAGPFIIFQSLPRAVCEYRSTVNRDQGQPGPHKNGDSWLLSHDDMQSCCLQIMASIGSRYANIWGLLDIGKTKNSLLAG